MEAAFGPSRRWPPKLGTPEGNRLLLTDAGAVAFVLICLRRCDPSVTPAEALAIARDMTPEEGLALRRIAYGIPPWREVAAELGLLEEHAGPAMDWAEAFADLAERYGWMPGEVGELTLGQWRAYRTGKSDVYRGRRPVNPRHPDRPDGAAASA
jgi:hypothetical protein